MDKIFAWIIGVSIMAMTLPGCAAPNDEIYYGPNDRVYYAFSIGLGSNLPSATNIRYRYGEVGERRKPVAHYNGTVFLLERLEMTVPEDFEVTWETADGKQHQATVPVRSKIRESLEGKTVLFRIEYNEVQGFISKFTPAGEQLERFY